MEPFSNGSFPESKKVLSMTDEYFDWEFNELMSTANWEINELMSTANLEINE
jgi:hypothetical protein